MGFSAAEWDFICTECNKKGVYDLMIYNPLRKELFFEEGIDEKYISGVDSYGKPYTAAKVGRKTFDILFNKLFADGGHSVGFFEYGNECETSHRNKGNKISKETVFKAIKGELSGEELDEIIANVDLEEADYYDFNALMTVIEKFLHDEISKNYYRTWTIVVSMALAANPFKANSKKQLLYENMSDCFDGHSFGCFEKEKEIECHEMIAFLKHYNHSLQHIRKSNEPPFYNEKEVAVYVCFDYCNHHNVYYKLCVADAKKKVFRIFTVANPFYLKNINYTFVNRDDFEELKSTYYEFYHDRSMDVQRFIVELPHLDVNGNTPSST